MDLQKIKADIELAREVSPSGWMLDLATLDSMVELIERQESELRQNQQALTDSNLALMEQQEIAQATNRQAEELQAELRIAHAACDAQGELKQKYQALALEATQTATHQPAPESSQQGGGVAKPYGWLVKMNDGHETYFREEPIGFRSESWKGLAEVIDLYATQPPADVAPAWDADSTNRLRSIVDLLGLQPSVPEGDLTGYEFAVLGFVRREIERLKAAQPSTAQGDSYVAAQDDSIGYQSGDEREAFEAVTGKLGKWLYTRNADGTYQEIAMQGFWSIWQAALAQRAASAEEARMAGHEEGYMAAMAEVDAAHPDMLWDASDTEVFANGAEEFANDYAHGNLSPGDVSEVKVQCAARLPDRTLRIEFTRDENRTVKWEWIDAAIAAQQGVKA